MSSARSFNCRRTRQLVKQRFVWHRRNWIDCDSSPTGIALCVAVEIIKPDTLNFQRGQCEGFIPRWQRFRLILGTLDLGEDKPVIYTNRVNAIDCSVSLPCSSRVVCLALQLTGTQSVRAFSPLRTCLPSSFHRMNVAMGPGCRPRALHCISASSWLPTL